MINMKLLSNVQKGYDKSITKNNQLGFAGIRDKQTQLPLYPVKNTYEFGTKRRSTDNMFPVITHMHGKPIINPKLVSDDAKVMFPTNLPLYKPKP